VTAGDGAIGAPGPVRRGGRLVAWCALAGVLAAISYAGRAAGEKPPDDVLYLWSTFVGAVVQYVIMFVLVLAIARGLDRKLLALRVPERRRRAVGLAFAALGIIVVTTAVLSRFLDAGDEQGLVPKGWDSSRAAPFVANFVVVAGVAPFVEELMFRGLGYSLLRPLGEVPAILWVGVAFGIYHGLLDALPILIAFGSALALVRARTNSVYPGMVVHALFNAIALIASVTT